MSRTTEPPLPMTAETARSERLISRRDTAPLSKAGAAGRPADICAWRRYSSYLGGGGRVCVCAREEEDKQEAMGVGPRLAQGG
eukprot:2198472-Pleurochrysis_carterae.AAC.1